MLRERLERDYREALKQKDSVKISILRILKSDIQNYMIEKKLKELKDEEMIGIIQKRLKRHKEAIEQFGKGGRDDLVQKEKAEQAILKIYVPEPLSEDELKAVIKDAMRELQTSRKKDFGRVMKAVIEQVKGRADGKKISALVNELLGD